MYFDYYILLWVIIMRDTLHKGKVSTKVFISYSAIDDLICTENNYAEINALIN